MMKEKALLVLAVLLCYAGALLEREQEFFYDDRRFISDNEHIRDLGNFPRFFSDPRTVDEDGWSGIYRPLRTLDFAVDWEIAGGETDDDSAGGDGGDGGDAEDDAERVASTARWFRLRNVLYHAVSVLLLFALLRRWRFDRPTAFLGSLVFAVHPVQVEAVAWITSRGDCLFLMFLLAALLLHARSERWGLAFGGTVACLSLSLLSKEAAVVFPAAVVLSDFFFRDGRSPRATLRRWPKYLVYLGICAAYYLLFRQVHDAYGGEVSHMCTPWGGTWIAELMTMLRGFVYYARLTLFPVDMAHDFHVAPVVSPDPLTALCAVLVLGAIGYAVYRMFRGGGVVAFTILWCFVALAPVSNVVVTIGIPTAERFLYLPMVGIALLAGTVLARAARQGRAGTALAVAVLVSLLCVSFERARIWTSEKSLWEAAKPRFDTPRGIVWQADQLRRGAREWVSREQRYWRDGQFEEALRARDRTRPDLQRALTLFERGEAYWEKIAAFGDALRVKAKRAITLAELGRSREALRLAEVVEIQYPTMHAGSFAVFLARYGLHQRAAALEWVAAETAAAFLAFPLNEPREWFDDESLWHLRAAADALERALGREGGFATRREYLRAGAAVYAWLANYYGRPRRRNTAYAYQSMRRSWECLPDRRLNGNVRDKLDNWDRRFEQDLERIEAAPESEPGTPSRDLELATHYAKFGYTVNAARIFDRLLGHPEHGENPEILYQCAHYFWQWQETVVGHRKAIELYEKILRIRALRPEVRGPREEEVRRQIAICRRQLEVWEVEYR